MFSPVQPHSPLLSICSFIVVVVFVVNVVVVGLLVVTDHIIFSFGQYMII